MAQRLRITCGQASHVGLKRSENQDAYGTSLQHHETCRHGKGLLFIVADGMGGHVGGREASEMAVHVIEETYFASSATDPARCLQEAIEAANRQVFERSAREVELRGMGTTCTVLALCDDAAWIGHVGDSRAYLISPQEIEQLTVDHTRVEEMVRQNLLTRAEAAVHPQRNVLQRALGVSPDVEVDLSGRIALEPGQRYLLCSDGLSYVSEEEIRAAVLRYPPQEACDRLVQLANATGGYDNVTVQVIHIEDVPGWTRRRKGGFRFFSWSVLSLRWKENRLEK